jgi:hypothetical protein
MPYTGDSPFDDEKDLIGALALVGLGCGGTKPSGFLMNVIRMVTLLHLNEMQYREENISISRASG